ncbi:MAG TPA: S41 family peptidase [Epulopiscium sp.]|nr:S41 family peptidase [Candidatus Epulonipiscium sp.]
MNNKKSFIGGMALGVLGAIVLALGMFLVPNVFAKEASTNDKLQYIRKLLESNYVGDIAEGQLEEGIYKGFVAAVGDPYTNYFTKEEFDQFKEKTSGTYAGIGIMMQVDQTDKLITAVQVFENSPAEKAGLLPKDKIIEAEGVALSGENFDEAPKIIKGEAGTVVNIKVFRPSENKTMELAITRENVIYPTVEHKMLADDIGYIHIKQFDEVTYTQFMSSLEEIQKKNPKGIILDVRDNLGGLLNIVAQISDELLPEGMIVYTKDKNDKIQALESAPGQIDIPITLLINENSASASEILAGALKDHKRAKLVGTTTYGKGVVQVILQIPDGSGIKVTTSKYYTPNDICIDGIGVEPDYEVLLPIELLLKPKLEDSEDLQLQKAIEVIKMEIK